MIAMIGGSPAANGSNVTQYSATTCGHKAETPNAGEPIMTLAPVCRQTAAMARSTHHQHRDAGMVQDLLRLASEYEPRDTLPAMRCHHDQVASRLLSRCDDGFVGSIAPLRDGVALDAGELRLAPQRREQPVRVSLRKRLQFLGWRLQQFLDDSGRIEFRHGVKARHASVDFLGERHAQFDRVARTRIVVDWNENVREHVWVSLGRAPSMVRGPNACMGCDSGRDRRLIHDVANSRRSPCGQARGVPFAWIIQLPTKR